MVMLRTIVVWCPDWPVIAAEIVDGYPADEPVAVLHANRVLATSPAARAEGVRRGLRKREAQGRCPHLIVLEHDPGRDMRAFEPVLAAVEELAPGVETLRPGACALAARGPARYYGGEAVAAERIVEHIAQRCDVEAQVGVAEGTFAAGLAARAGVLVPPGETAAFLADLSITALGRPALADLLRRLGIHTLAEFAALPGPDVLARFGFDAALAHRLAGGNDERPLAPRRPPPDLDVTETFDEPVERVDAAAFAARALAERLHERLGAHGLACTRLGIEATTVTGQELLRTWRHDGLLSVNAIADRLRWQLDGWLTGTGKNSDTTRPNGAIARLRLIPEGVVEHLGLQPGLWGEAGDERDRAHRALTRVQGLLGPDAVLTAVLDGGRADSSRIRLVAFGDERVAQGTDAPWPGRLPSPSPATVYPEPLPAEVLDGDGRTVRVSGRLELSGAPATVRIGDGQPVGVVAWAGPWPADERWWDDGEARRRARFQLQLADDQAILAVLEEGTWHVEALYD
ncbi:DNA polymerase Y family protein [Dactylosporangium aurantiacum]|uniref:DNA polymerase Y family protein n=1 Tax=Dactylosporangium aurantiacum TaxID=35754 RepID=A0A9Q9IDC7_9ACTN|nr:DNA polymerase Y family protein [Dactylosporangium aurantiacum]MDG6102496.1 DNA polymerase Y family protein [Dactylosporangium aurantiacum]UWZ53226.1 DNA polymerase Y family protein [Dactylosporangium aurantiacum]